MRHTVQVVVRMPAALAARLDSLVPELERDPALSAASRVTRSTAARLALARGLEQLERELGAAHDAEVG